MLIFQKKFVFSIKKNEFFEIAYYLYCVKKIRTENKTFLGLFIFTRKKKRHYSIFGKGNE